MEEAKHGTVTVANCHFSFNMTSLEVVENGRQYGAQGQLMPSTHACTAVIPTACVCRALMARQTVVTTFSVNEHLQAAEAYRS